VAITITAKVDLFLSAPSNIQIREGIQALKDLWQDICKQQRQHNIEEGDPMPIMTKHLTFSIPSINASKQTICGAIEGFDGSWTPPIDFLGKRLILQEIIRVVLQTTSCLIITELNEEKELLMGCLGVHHYTPTQGQVESTRRKKGAPPRSRKKPREPRSRLI